MKQKAIFLDRDGVLTVEKGYVTSLEHMEIFPYAQECIDKIHKKDYLAIVITNQSAVGRNMMPEKELLDMNRYLIQKIHVDEIYYCPHWYDENTAENKYNIKCDCRKPNTRLVEQAINKYNIDTKFSFFVGDRASDIQTGINSGIPTVLLESGYGSKRLEQDIKPDYIFNNLEEFVNSYLLKKGLF